MTTTTIRHRAGRRPVVAPAAVALVALLAVLVALLDDRTAGNSPDGAPGPATRTADARADVDLGIEVVVGDEVATAMLDDTPEAREFAAMLPVRVEMDDPFGQAKTGSLPVALDVDDAPRSRRYGAGDLSYWSPSGKLAIVYDALGESVPPPGLVRLGTVDTGLSGIASAGNHFTMTIRRGK